MRAFHLVPRFSEEYPGRQYDLETALPFQAPRRCPRLGHRAGSRILLPRKPRALLARRLQLPDCREDERFVDCRHHEGSASEPWESPLSLVQLGKTVPVDFELTLTDKRQVWVYVFRDYYHAISDGMELFEDLVAFEEKNGPIATMT